MLKKDGWTKCGLKLEDDLYNESIDWEYDEVRILHIVKQVYKTPYLNRLKQFFLRLLRNNLFLGNRNQKLSSSDPYLCFMCSKHPERHVPILYSCEVVKGLIYKLVEILRGANLLKNGASIEVFLFKEYDFNSIENLALVTLWDFVYKARFDPDRYSTC